MDDNEMSATDNEKLVEAVPADREAAAAIWRDYVAKIGECMAENCLRRGDMDDSPLVQAFARHRQAAEAAAIERAATICETQAKVFLSEQYAVGQPFSSFGERFACGMCVTAIRALSSASAGEG